MRNADTTSKLILIAGCAVLAAGCVPVPLPPTKEVDIPACARTAFPANERIDAATVDKYAGTYSTNTQKLTVRRDEHRLLVEQTGYGTRELTTDNLDSGTWRDGCGATYEFMLPPDGPGAMLNLTDPDGSKSRWRREGY